jgi:large subunit ribosomal protein L23
MLKPVYTEKSLANAKRGSYSFWVDKGLNKGEIKILIGKTFDVHVVSVKTVNYKKEIKRSYRGVIQKLASAKKAIVTLKDKEKIDIFEETKKK